MKKYLWIGLILFCAVDLVSCGDSEKSSPTYKDGDACDTNTFHVTCDESHIVTCNNDSIQLIDCAERSTDSQAVCVEFSHAGEAEVCDEEDEDCTNSDQPVPSTIACISPEEECTSENDIQVRCEKSYTGYTYLRSYKCEKTTDGKLFYHHVSYEKCYDGYGVCSNSGECLEPVACETGYTTHCEGDTLYRCNKNRLFTSDCTSYPSPHTCSVIEDTPKCLDPENACQTEGEEIVTRCNAKTGKESISICTRAENGNLYYNPAGTRTCLSGCNDSGTACKQMPCSQLNDTKQNCRLQSMTMTYIDTYTCQEQNGEKVFVLSSSDKCDNGHGTCSDDGQCVPAASCEKSSFSPKCENGAAVNCTSSQIRLKHCEISSTSPICAVVNNSADCFSESDICTTEGEEIVTRCSDKTNKESVSKCTRGSDGKLYYVSNGQRACSTRCNEEGTACAK